MPDPLGRDFTAQAPNRRYAGDIIYLPLADGTNLYLATVIDCYSRRLVGWSITDHMRTSLVTDALTAAAARGGATALADAVFHSSTGRWVCTSSDYAQLCAHLGVVTQSMGAIGSSVTTRSPSRSNPPLTGNPPGDRLLVPRQATFASFLSATPG